MSVALAVLAAVSCAASVAAWGAAVRVRHSAVGTFTRLRAEIRASQTARESEPKWLTTLRGEVDELTWEASKRLREARSLNATSVHAVRRAREELAESGLPADERLEGLSEELGLFDDDGSEESGVLPMRTNVESAPEPAPGGPASGSPESWESLARRRKFGA